MQIPARRLEIAKVFEGRTSESGWLVIDIRGMDLEGVVKLHVNLDEVETLGRKRAEVKERLTTLFGADDDEDLA